MDHPVKDIMLYAKDGDEPISKFPSTVRDIVDFGVKYPKGKIYRM